METTKSSIFDKVRKSYLLLLFLVVSAVWWVIFAAMMISQSTDFGFFGYFVIIPVVSLMFSAGTLIVYRLVDNKRWGCYVIVAMAIVIPLFAVLIVRVSHWLAMKIYLGEKENLVAGWGYVIPTAKETSGTESA